MSMKNTLFTQYPLSNWSSSLFEHTNKLFLVEDPADPPVPRDIYADQLARNRYLARQQRDFKAFERGQAGRKDDPTRNRIHPGQEMSMAWTEDGLPDFVRTGEQTDEGLTKIYTNAGYREVLNREGPGANSGDNIRTDSRGRAWRALSTTVMGPEDTLDFEEAEFSKTRQLVDRNRLGADWDEYNNKFDEWEKPFVPQRVYGTGRFDNGLYTMSKKGDAPDWNRHYEATNTMMLRSGWEVMTASDDASNIPSENKYTTFGGVRWKMGPKVIARRDKRVKYEDDNSAWRKSDAGKAAQHARSQSELETRKQFGGRDGTPEEQRIRAIDRQSSRAISQKAYNDARSAHFASVASGVTVEDTGIDLGGPVTPDSLGLPSTPKPAAVEEPAAVAEPNGSGFGPESLGKGPPSARGGSIEGYDPAVQQGIYNNGATGAEGREPPLRPIKNSAPPAAPADQDGNSPFPSS